MGTWVPGESDRAAGDGSPGVDSPRRPLDAWKGHLGRTRRTNGLPPVLSDLNLLAFFFDRTFPFRVAPDPSRSLLHFLEERDFRSC